MDDDDLGERLRASIGALVRASRAHADAMPEAQSQTLGFLLREGSLTVAELAQRRKVRHQSMQTAVVELERAGLVERTPDPRDRRARLVGLTDEGHRTLRDELGRRRSLLATAIATELDADEQALLARVPDLLQRLAARL
ncbi:MarR family winged helix-turn-helix transcriptional regulator [Nocardioides sp. CPCC 205120]|uniref:MarR family winged helix-turn-helix transcriptional regulator n=1 Tax=Nocardioides sp. CPCC 205120 TaxID=3406462 RepID=UPI003B50A8A1